MSLIRIPITRHSYTSSHTQMPLYILALHQHVLGGVRTIVKKSFQYVPAFGWGMWACYWPFISRDFAKVERERKEKRGKMKVKKKRRRRERVEDRYIGRKKVKERREEGRILVYMVAKRTTRKYQY